LHVTLTGEQVGYYSDFSGLADLATALEQVFVYTGQLAPSRGEPHGYPAGDLDRRRFIGYSQNHDQVGNRAVGDRLAHLVGPGRLEIAAALVLTAPFVPMLFQGEEWAASAPFQYFTDHQDPELAEAVRAGRRAEFAGLVGRDGEIGADGDGVPDPQDPETFRRSRLDWAELAVGEHARLLEWYRRLIALRRSEPALADGRPAATSVESNTDEGWLVLHRGPLAVVINLGEERSLPLDGDHELVLANDQRVELTGGTLRAAPDTVAILRRV
jgi:maltooligosyltrehalose trehalohydrolase